MNPQQFEQLRSLYELNPGAFSPEQVSALKETAQGLSLPFHEKSDFSLGRTIAQLGAGFVSGFTTLPVGDDPKNSVEAITRSIGQVMGFVGFIPGPGLAGKLAASAVGRAVGLSKVGARLAAQPANLLGRYGGKSLPLVVGSKVAERVAGEGAESAVVRFLTRRGIGADAATKGFDAVREGVQLGAASAVSAWTGGVDAMVQGSIMGGLEGAGFRVIGNMIPGGSALNTGLRAVSNALYAGLPSTLADDPLELQVYNYLLGTYFGIADRPLDERQALKFMEDGLAAASSGKSGDKVPLHERLRVLMAPDQMPGFDKLTATAQDLVRQQTAVGTGRMVKTAFGEDATTPEVLAELAVARTVAKHAFEHGGQMTDLEIARYVTGASIEAQAKALEDGKDYEEALSEGSRSASEAASEVAAHLGALFGSDFEARREVPHDAQSAIEDHDLSIEDIELGAMESPILRLAKLTDDPVASEQVLRTELARYAAQQDTPEAFEALWENARQLGGEIDQEPSRLLLRRAIKSFSRGLPREKGYVDADGELVQNVQHLPSGKRIAESVAPSHIESRLGGTRPEERVAFTAHQVRYNDEGRLIDDEVFHTPESEGGKWIDVVNTLRKAGRVPLFGNKDKGAVISTPDFLWKKRAPHGWAQDRAFSERDVSAYLRQRLDAMSKIDPRVTEHWAELKAQAVAEGIDADDFDRMALNNIMAIEDLNAYTAADGEPPRYIPFEEMMSSGHFLRSASALNKRAQPMADGNVTPSYGFYLDLGVGRGVDGAGTTVADRGGIPYLILEDPHGPAISRDGRELPALTIKGYDKQGNLVDEEAWAKTDGLTIIHSRLFDRMALDMGVDSKSGSIKASNSYANELGTVNGIEGQPLGMAILKQQYLRATPEQDAAMDAALDGRGVLMLVHGSAAKQRGYRDKALYEVARDGSIILEGGRGEYIAPLESFRLNAASSENGKKATEAWAKLVLQAHTNLGDAAAVERLMERYARPSVEGTGKASDPALKRLSVGEVLGALYPKDGNYDRALFAEIAREIALGDQAASNGDDADTGLGFRDDQDIRSSAHTFFEAMLGGNPEEMFTPENVFLTDAIERYFSQAVRTHLVQRLSRFATTHSGKGTLTGQDPWQRQQLAADAKSVPAALYGGELRRSMEKGILPPGYFQLGRGHAQRKIKWLTKAGKKTETTLEEAWSDIAKERNPNRRKALEDLLTHAVVRVPMASASGLRMLRFAGFTAYEGGGVMTHPSEMEMLGGADLDIDSAFFYQDLDGDHTGRGPIRDYYERPEVAHRTRDEQGVVRPAKRPEFDAEMVREQTDAERSFVGMLDVRTAMRTAQAARQGNKTIGVPAVVTRRVNALLPTYGSRRPMRGRIPSDDVFDAVGTNSLALLGPELSAQISGSYQAFFKPDLNPFWDSVDAALNYAADAADAPLSMGPQGVMRWLSARLLEARGTEKILVASAEGRVDLDTALDMGLVSIDQHKALEAAQRKLRDRAPSMQEVGAFLALMRADAATGKGRNGDAAPTIAKTLRGLNDLRNLDVGGTWYQILQRLPHESQVRPIGDDLSKPRVELVGRHVPGVGTRVLDPSHVAPIAPEAMVRARDMLIELQRDPMMRLLVGGTRRVSISESSFNYDAFYKAQNDYQDLVSAHALAGVGQAMVRDLAQQGLSEKQIATRVRQLQRAVYKRAGEDPSGGPPQAFRARMLRAMGLSRNLEGTRERKELVDKVFEDMTAFSRGLTPPERRYFEMLLVSTTMPTSMDASRARAMAKERTQNLLRSSNGWAIVKGAVAALRGAKGGHAKAAMHRRFEDAGISLEDAPQPAADGGTEADAFWRWSRGKVGELMEHEYGKSFQRTGSTRGFLSWPGLSPQTVRDYMRAGHDVSKRFDTPEPLRLSGKQGTAPKNFDLAASADVVGDKEGVPIDMPTQDGGPERIRPYGVEVDQERIESMKRALEHAPDLEAAAKEFVGTDTEEGRKNEYRLQRLEAIFAKIATQQPHMLGQIEQIFGGVLEGGSRRGVGIATNFRAASMRDIDTFIEFFDGARSGTLLRALHRDKDPAELPSWATLFFPESMGRWAREDDFHIGAQVRSQVMTRRGLKEGHIRRFFSTTESLSEIAAVMVEGNNARVQLFTESRQQLLGWLANMGTEDNPLANDMMVVATALRELPLEEGVTQERWRQVKKRYLDLVGGRGEKEEVYHLRAPVLDAAGRVRLNPDGSLVLKQRAVTGRQLIGTEGQQGLIGRSINELVERRQRWLYNEEAERQWIAIDERGGVDYRATLRKIGEHLAKTRRAPELGQNGLNRIMHEMQVRYHIKLRLPRWRAEELGLVKPRRPRAQDRDFVDKIAEDETTIVLSTPDEIFKERRRQGRPLSEKQYLDVLEAAREAEPFQYQGDKGNQKLRSRSRSGEVQFRDTDTYWPRNSHDRKTVRTYMANFAAKVALDSGLIEGKKGDGREAERIRVRALLQRQYVAGNLPEEVITEPIRQILFKEPHKGENTVMQRRPAPLMARGEKALPGYDGGIAALRAYDTSLAKGYYDTFGALLMQERIRDFEERAPMKGADGKDYTKEWADFMRMQLNQFMGFSSLLDADLLSSNPKIGRSMYYFSSDTAALKTYNKVRRFFGKEEIDLNPNMVGAQKFAAELSRISTLEGKWEMMTLLANTRSLMNNIVGGSAMTLASTGFRPFLRATSLSSLQRINPNWNSWEKIERWAWENGAAENYLISEVNLSPVRSEFKKENIQRFWNDAMALLRRKPDAPDSDLMEIARKNSVKDRFLDGAAFFMRASERKLRLHAYLSHYLKAYDTLGGSRYNIDPEDPVLLEWARKGVEGTQFLYHSSARPLFSSTSLGKLFSRFQTWSWNSIRFRQDVYRSAREQGFTPGTDSFDRYKRTAIADLFMLGLASALPYSMFDATVPAPWNYVQELSAFFFGDSEERERAFFGVLPYPANIAGLVTPPSTRVFTAMAALAGGDVDRFVDYHLYTMLPFGMLARNGLRTIDNPMMAVEFNTGFPLHGLGRYLAAERDRDEGGSLLTNPTLRTAPQ